MAQDVPERQGVVREEPVTRHASRPVQLRHTILVYRGIISFFHDILKNDLAPDGNHHDTKSGPASRCKPGHEFPYRLFRDLGLCAKFLVPTYPGQAYCILTESERWFKIPQLFVAMLKRTSPQRFLRALSGFTLRLDKQCTVVCATQRAIGLNVCSGKDAPTR